MPRRARTAAAVDDQRVPILYLAPWVDIGGTDTSTIDWFRCLDRQRFALNLITTQPSPNRRLGEVAPYVDEVWELPQLIDGDEFPRFILGFIHTRGVQVVHVMNSRLGFDLLPEIAALEDPPRVVVQLHGEEPDASGYVRYVAARYGNLVHAFSMTTRLLDERLEAYEVGSSKRRYIPVGVDAEEEFNPGRVTPAFSSQADALQILFPSRLVPQKDPLRAVEVADELRARGLSFQLHLVGDGELTEAVRGAVYRAGLEEVVRVHGADPQIAPWYAASHLVLMTSDFETSAPRAAYEAMAMGIPVVGPRMPCFEELVATDTGCLVDASAGAAGYADAICALAADASRRRSMGEAGRALVRERYTVRRMAAEHEALYEELLERRRVRPVTAPRQSATSVNDAPAFRRPSPEERPLVSVIVACFNHGRYLRDCLGSVRAQPYKPIETIVVDDGSDDPETVEVLSELERDGWAVCRLPENRGPSAARNAGIDRARGRYVLPLDADDMLAEDAVAALVHQLREAPDGVGFVYPNLQFFGNRRDYWEPPSYNLHALLNYNLCAVSSLFDREIFDRGLRYAEDLELGQEDWDFVLTLAEHGIYGEAARSKTLLCRRQGFTRNDLIEATRAPGKTIAARHRALFEHGDAIKAEWNPALSLVGLGPGAAGALDAKQTCPDYEVVTAPAVPPGRRLAEAYRQARGRYVMATYHSIEALLEDPPFVEKTLRIFRSNRRLTALALADGGAGRMPFQRLEADTALGAAPSALCWLTTRDASPPTPLALPHDRPLDALARWLTIHGRVEWRHLPDPASGTRDPATSGATAVLEPQTYARGADAAFKEAPPALPGIPKPDAGGPGVWRPPQTRLVCRHRHATNWFVYTHEPAPPAEYVLDHVLGGAREFPLPGTSSITARPAGDGFGRGETIDPLDPAVLGFLEQRPLPLLDAVLRGRHRITGQELLAAGEDDPLLGELEDPVLVGWIEPQPIRPRLAPEVEVPYGLVGLVRSVDLAARRHRYGLGHVPPGLAAGELGALLAQPTGDCLPLWIDPGGRLVTDDGPPANGRPDVRTAVRWAAEPLRWTDFRRRAPKLRATARRAIDSTLMLAARSKRNGGTRRLGGYLLRSATPRTVPLYASIHPVTGDQLLSTSAREGSRLGYGPVRLLGHLAASAPTTGELGIRRPATPWATRFGAGSLERGL